MVNRLDVPQAAQERAPRFRRRLVLRPIGPTLRAEMRVQRVVSKVIREGAEVIRDRVLPLYASAKGEMLLDGAVIDEQRVDDDLASIASVLTWLRSYMGVRINQFSPQLRAILEDEELKHRKAFSASINSTAGIDITPVLRDPEIAPHIQAATTQNVTLIQGVADDMVKRVGTRVIEAARTGRRSTDLAKDIQKDMGITQRRAKLIARDQMASFNASLNKTRQEQVGITKYVWSTSLDERVRDEHAEREGRTFSWDDPPEDGHPGEPINCRCVARAVIEP